MRGIREKLLVYLGAFIVVICLGLGISSYAIARNSLISNLKKTLPEIAIEASNTIEERINGQFGKLESIAARSDVNDPNIDFATKRQILIKEAERIGSMTLDFVDANGDVLHSDGQIFNIGDREYIKSALQGNRVVTDPELRKSNNTLSVRYVVPVKNGDEIIGVLLESRDGNALSEYTDEIEFGESGSAFIINKDGTSIANKDRDAVLQYENLITSSENDASLEEIADVHKKMTKKVG
ncbi:Cache domain-containing protein [Clostridium sp. DSM 8431]|uniref:cache domain-containing protein n=1 Tax=Clostridium sp. DSM 8431 TaxID=1761781 RepID=UPI0008EC0C41|nr:cache domain-containing protein [Clostridium sp. DSM 8431]SFU55438.1 Cache domain-containing protein [Clostridium sp. DSM 8431]